MRRFLFSLLAVLLLASLTVAVPQEAKKEKKEALYCKLTDKKIDSCCCEHKKDGGKLYCKLAKKEIDKCCCENAEKAKAKKG